MLFDWSGFSIRGLTILCERIYNSRTDRYPGHGPLAMILDLDRLRMEHAKSYQVDEGSAGREPLVGV